MLGLVDLGARLWDGEEHTGMIKPLVEEEMAE